MPQCIVSPAAEQDIEAILFWTEEQFGQEARLRYEAILIQAIADLAEDATRPGSHNRPELAASARTYHVRHSRNNVTLPVGRVKNPRHFLLYRVRDDGRLEISRILHDSMDLEKHLPNEYRVVANDD